MFEMHMNNKSENILKAARESIKEQARALDSLAADLDNEFVMAVSQIIASKGRLVISGMGKSGHIGKKMAASMASTGTRAFFMHPGEAFHGDLGMVAPEDIVLLISNSGESDEILKLIPPLKKFGNKIISIHGSKKSTLAKNSDINLIVKVDREICPHNLAPTTSTIAAMAMGDALTVSLMKERKFQPEEFADYHPGGSLGKRLLSSVKDKMTTVNMPVVAPDQTIHDCLFIMTESGKGIAVIVNEGKILGTLTDGDLRRALIKDCKILQDPVSQYMNRSPRCINMNRSLVDADNLMAKELIKSLLVVDDIGHLVGIL